MSQRTVLCAPDKFRGTATAAEVVAAVASAVESRGWTCDGAPLADGGEGTIDVLPGTRVMTTVCGPIGRPVRAAWNLCGEVAIIEMAQASGHIALGDEPPDAVSATTRGTGELIRVAIEAGAKRIIVGAGGSVTTDGGSGAVDVLRPLLPLRDVEVVVATDVRTTFVACAEMFGPQKGATAAHIPVLEARLRTLVDAYRAEFGVDVSELPGGGAAGGLAGGLAAIGARVELGFPYFAGLVNLDKRIAAADVIVTGEGKFDVQSTHGKVVDGVIHLARLHRKPVVVIAGAVDRDGLGAYLEGGDLTVVSLVEQFGLERALADTLGCITEAADFAFG
jgi:glycerate kinase